MSWETAVSNVGFPIAVAIYLLVSREKVIKNNTRALFKVEAVMRECKKNG